MLATCTPNYGFPSFLQIVQKSRDLSNWLKSSAQRSQIENILQFQLYCAGA